MTIDVERTLRKAADDVASTRGIVLYVLFAAFGLASLVMYQTLTRALREWAVSIAPETLDQFPLPEAPLALDVGLPVLAVGLVLSFVITEVLRLVAVRSFASDASAAVPTAAVTEDWAKTLLVLIGASLLVQVLVFGGLFLLVVPGLVAAVLTVFVRQAVLLDDEGVLDSIRTSISLVVDELVPVLALLVTLFVLSFLVGLPTIAFDPDGVVSPVVGSLLGSTVAVYGVAVFTRAYQQAGEESDGIDEPLGPDDLEDDNLETNDLEDDNLGTDDLEDGTA